jgi:hypothetical protein
MHEAMLYTEDARMLHLIHSMSLQLVIELYTEANLNFGTVFVWV